MRIEGIDRGFIHFIENGVVEKVVATYDGVCVVHFYDKPSKKLHIENASYDYHYGLPVSADGFTLFYSDWDTGLHAYDIMSGTVRWHLKKKKIRGIFVYSDYLIALQAYTSVLKIDIASGEVLDEIKSGTLEKQFDLNGVHILVHSIRGKLSVLDPETMAIVKSYGSIYKSKIINPLDSLSVMLLSAVLQDNTLTLTGWEKDPSRDPNSYERDSNEHERFTRVIDTEFDSFLKG